MANMVYIELDELKEILPEILSPWIDDEGDLEFIFNEIEQKCHIGKKKKDKKEWKQYVEDEIDVLKSKIDEYSTVLSAYKCDINKLTKRVDELSNKVSNLSSSNISMAGRIDTLSRDITAAKSMAQTAKQRTEVDYTKISRKKACETCKYSSNMDGSPRPIEFPCDICKYNDKWEAKDE